MKTAALVIVAILLSACGAIPVNSYDGSSAADVKRPENKAELIEVLRPPDASTIDGRFYLYFLEKTTDWHIVAFGVPGESWITVSKPAAALYEFDLHNRVTDVTIHTCEVAAEDNYCEGDATAALWRMIESQRSADYVVRYRQQAAMTAKYAGDWHTAVTKGDLRALEGLLGKGVSIRLEHDGSNALHMAAASGNIPMIDFLLARNLPIATLDAVRAETPLLYAVRAGAADAVRHLLQRGSDVNSGNLHGIAPLHVAAASNSTRLVELLISNGANVNARSKDGRTPLFVAVTAGHEQVVRLLLDRSASVDTHSEGSATPLAIAARNGSVEILRLLLAHGADPNDRGYFWNGDTPLIIAIEADQLETARLLIMHGANVNKGTSWSMPLHNATMRGNAQMVELLLANGANVNDKTRIHDSTRKYVQWRRVTPLTIAVENSDDAVASLLLNAGARY